MNFSPRWKSKPGLGRSKCHWTFRVPDSKKNYLRAKDYARPIGQPSLQTTLDTIHSHIFLCYWLVVFKNWNLSQAVANSNGRASAILTIFVWLFCSSKISHLMGGLAGAGGRFKGRENLHLLHSGQSAAQILCLKQNQYWLTAIIQGSRKEFFLCLTWWCQRLNLGICSAIELWPLPC